MTVRRQVETFITVAGVVTVIVLAQVYTASILILAFVVVYTCLPSYNSILIAVA